MNMFNIKRIVYIIFLIGCFSVAQENEEKAEEKALRESNNLTWEGNQDLTTNKFEEAEVEYRKAISKSDKNTIAPYNLGNAYYNNATYSEAFGRFKQAGEKATSKAEKHMAYHNMGNVFMKRKEYQKAVESYKNALRNNPTDEETRYNLALAKEMLKKDQENQDQNKDDKNEDKKDKKEEEKEGDNKEENKDKKDEGDQGDKEENKEGDGDKKEEQNKKPEQSDKEKKQQPRPNQLSKQQIQNLLEAMQQEEKKVQQKIDAKKVKGVKVKNEKDW